VHVPRAELTAGVRTAWYALTVVAAGLVLASAVIGDRLAAKVVGSARSLADAAAALGDGDLNRRVRPTGPRELAEAGVAFNQMAERLATLRTNEREMVADLSHRLRTPLTALRLDVEALDVSDPMPSRTPDTDARRTVRRIRQAIGTLEREIDVLIRTTRQAVAAVPEPVAAGCDASQVVQDRMVFWSALAGDQHRPCTVLGTGTPAPINMPAAEVAAALDALLGNVFRYTPQGTAVEVSVSRHDGWVAVRVDDAGPGIANPDRALRRGTSDRGSTGLGLDIARRVSREGGGSVSIDRARLGGASVVMLFADAEAPPPPPPSRFGLIGRLAREPRSRAWPRPRRRTEPRPRRPAG
jgi:signal transduction histidine kinase